MGEISNDEVGNVETNSGEVSETENCSEVCESEMDEDLSRELDEKYDSYINEDTNSEKDLDSDSDNEYNDVDESERDGLNDTEKEQLKEETGWSEETVDAMHSKEEAEIYKNADLHEAEVNGKKCLIRNDIDMEQKDEFGRTNKERMENGNAPLTESGETVELHHIGQKQDSPLAELTTQEHRGKGNDTILHDKQKDSEIDRGEFAKERKQHWESRAENI